MSLGDLLFRVLDFVLNFLPFQIINAHEQGVRLQLGKIRSSEPLEAGFHWLLPFFHEIATIDKTQAAYEGWTQTVTSSDGFALTVAGALTYSITNYATFYPIIFTADDVLKVALSSAVTRAVGSLDYGAETTDEHAGVTDLLVAKITADLEPKFRAWGMKLEDVAILTFVEARPFRLIND